MIVLFIYLYTACTAGCETCSGLGLMSCQSCQDGYFHDGMHTCTGTVPITPKYKSLQLFNHF